MSYLVYAIGSAIIALLSGYALHLVFKLKQVEREQQQVQQLAEQKIRDHQHKLIDDIRFVARAMLANQCDITEGVLRLNYLISSLDTQTWEHYALVTLRKHHSSTASMPILDAYQALTKQQQFTLDQQRFRLEEEHRTALFKELHWLLAYDFPSITLVH